MSLVSCDIIQGLFQSEISSFDGTNFQSEASSLFSHQNVAALGNYRDSPFVTGGSESLKTEILDYGTSTWAQVEDYPFSHTNAYVSYQYSKKQKK